LSKWKVSWETKSGVSKKIHTQPNLSKTTGSNQKSIAEQLKLTINIPKKGNNACEEYDDDDIEKEEVEHENKRKKGKGKSGLADKGCLLDVSALFNE
jgi:hypothetical protein